MNIDYAWVLLAGAALVALAVWGYLRYVRTRYVVLYESSGTTQLARELARIADALERLVRERQGEQPRAEKPAKRPIASSMFGR